eukprot:11190647-Lingulodinium_polyedra.AAC.1
MQRSRSSSGTQPVHARSMFLARAGSRSLRRWVRARPSSISCTILIKSLHPRSPTSSLPRAEE